MAFSHPDARVTAVDVIEIVKTSLEEMAVNAFINSAHITVQNNLLNKGLSDDTLTYIELYLAAHFLSLYDPRIASEDIADEYSVKYETGKTDMGFAATVHGQQALTLDSTGTLASLGQKRASFRVY